MATKIEANQFDNELHSLCDKYSVFIKAVTDRKNKPGDHVHFREYTLSVKITSESEEKLLQE